MTMMLKPGTWLGTKDPDTPEDEQQVLSTSSWNPDGRPPVTMMSGVADLESAGQTRSSNARNRRT